MQRLESLFNLPKPDFEDGRKDPFTVGIRRLAKDSRLAGGIPQLVNGLTEPFLSPDIRKAKFAIEKSLWSKPGGELILANAIFLPNLVHLRASLFHVDSWLRDSFVSALAIDDPEVELALLKGFTDYQSREGQLATTRLFPGNRSWFFNDESTMLALIWRAKLLRMGVDLQLGEAVRWQKSLDWIKEHDANGLYTSPPGTERTWLDTYVSRTSDVFTYNQGIYATALLAAEVLGLTNDGSSSREAQHRYGTLIGRHGGLRFSINQRYLTDASALFGEYLAIKIFGKTLLEDDVVVRTLQSLAADQNGYKVVAVDNGSFLRPSEFNRPYMPGDYQNGAEWPLFSSISRATAESHGLRVDTEFWARVWRNLQASQNAEYVRAGKGDSLEYDSQRTNHTWNAAIYPLLKERVMLPEIKSTDTYIQDLQAITVYLDGMNRGPGF